MERVLDAGDYPLERKGGEKGFVARGNFKKPLFQRPVYTDSVFLLFLMQF